MPIDDIKITVLFNPDIIKKTGIKYKKPIYAENTGGKSKTELIENLNKKASGENIKFQKRKLPRTFNPLFSGFLLFSDHEFIADNILIDFGNIFFGDIEGEFGIKIINYSLIDVKKSIDDYISKFFYFEVFNYNFNKHRALKTDFTGSKNLNRVCAFAEDIFLKTVKKADKNRVKKTVKVLSKPVKDSKTAKSSPIRKKDSRGKIISPAEKVEVKPLEPFGQFTEVLEGLESIKERINLISFNWNSLSPSENHPVLEAGEPKEIYSKSIVRIYFQKPRVRQVVWRLRRKPEIKGIRPIMRVYVNDSMLWYELLDSYAGNKYIIFSEDFELYKTWAEVGYLTETGEFIFVARTPIWPPNCLFKTPPKIKSKKVIPGRFALIGATEGIPGGKHLPVSYGSGGSFFGSGSGKDIR